MRRMTLALVGLLALSLLSIPPTQSLIDYGDYGTHPEEGSDDFAMPLAALDATTQIPYLARDDTDSTGDEDDDHFFIHFDDATESTDKAVDDIRLAVPTGGTGSAGLLLTGSTATGTYDEVYDLDGDAATDAADRIDDFLCHVEVDGKPGFTDKDWLYVDVDDDDDLSVGDLRLSTPSPSGTSASGVTVPSLRYVDTGDDDLDAAAAATEHDLPKTVDCEATTFDLLYFDEDLSAEFDVGDTLVAVPSDAPSDSFLSLGQAFVSASGGRTHGNHVSSSQSDAPYVLEALGATEAWLVSTSAEGDACAQASVQTCDLYIHFGSPDGEPTGAYAAAGDLGYIQYGDIILRKGASGTGGGAASFMTRVTTEATGQGAAIKAYTELAAQVFYVNNPDGNDGFSDEDWLYLDVPSDGNDASAEFGGEDAVGAPDLSANDLRLTEWDDGSDSHAAGTTVKTSDDDMDSFDAEPVNEDSATPAWYLQHRDVDESQGRPLLDLTRCMYVDSTSNDVWDVATEEVYIDEDSSSTITEDDVRLWDGDLNNGETTTDAATLVADGDADELLATALEDMGDCRVSGADSTFDVDQGEWVAYSADAWMTATHDLAIIEVGAIAAGAALTATEAVSFAHSASGDAFYFQWDEATDPDGGTEILKIHDGKLASTIDFVAATDTGFVPTLHPVPVASQAFTWYDRGGDNPSEDGYYLEIGGTIDDLAQRDVRVAPTDFSTGGEAGAQLASDNTAELGAAATTLTQDAVEFYTQIYYFDEGDGPNGLDPTDPIYLDLDQDLGGGTEDDVSSFDIRLTEVEAGSETYEAGSFVRIGDEDLDFNAPVVLDAGVDEEAFVLYFFDENRDGSFNGDDVPYLVFVDDADVADWPATVNPDLLSIRMAGSGGSSGGGGGGGGDDDDDDDDDETTTTSSSTSTSTSTSSTSTSTSQTQTETGDSFDTGDVGEANTDLGDTIVVTETEFGMRVEWEAVDGAAGYQIWRSDDGGAFEYVHQAADPDTTSWLDDDGDADSTYIVTAYFRNADGSYVGFAQEFGNLPGSEDLDGSGPSPTTSKRKKGPGVGLPVAVVALAALAIALRRRL